MQNDVKTLISRINRRRLKNNTQKALFALLTSNDEWVNRLSIRVPSVGARLRDLRKSQFGGFNIECASACKLKRKSRRARTTFYRLNPNSVTFQKVVQVFEGVVDTSKL